MMDHLHLILSFSHLSLEVHCVKLYPLLFIVLADFPGWPLLTSVKVPMQKCDKCNKEFFSPINHRRHTRVHHRLKSLDKVLKL